MADRIRRRDLEDLQEMYLEVLDMARDDPERAIRLINQLFLEAQRLGQLDHINRMLRSANLGALVS